MKKILLGLAAAVLVILPTAYFGQQHYYDYCTVEGVFSYLLGEENLRQTDGGWEYRAAVYPTWTTGELTYKEKWLPLTPCTEKIEAALTGESGGYVEITFREDSEYNSLLAWRQPDIRFCSYDVREQGELKDQFRFGSQLKLTYYLYASERDLLTDSFPTMAVKIKKEWYFLDMLEVEPTLENRSEQETMLRSIPVRNLSSSKSFTTIVANMRYNPDHRPRGKLCLYFDHQDGTATVTEFTLR